MKIAETGSSQPRALSKRHDARRRSQPDGGDIDRQSEVLQDLRRCRREPPEGRPPRTQPPETEARQQSAGAPQRKRHAGQGHGDQANQNTENQTSAEIDEIRRVVGGFRLAEQAGGARHILRLAIEPQDVAGADLRSRQRREAPIHPLDPREINAAAMRTREGTSTIAAASVRCMSPASQHDVPRFDNEVDVGGRAEFRTEDARRVGKRRARTGHRDLVAGFEQAGFEHGNGRRASPNALDGRSAAELGFDAPRPSCRRRRRPGNHGCRTTGRNGSGRRRGSRLRPQASP